ncbi:MAG: heme exporter protein CcmB [Rhodocyclaceae bacterium]|nr:heme exporter protein CcmB [Rhodocyclaceae bacterium]
MLNHFHCILRRELLLTWHRRGDVLNTLAFFVIVVSLFPLAVGPEPERLRELCSGVQWVAGLLATLLSLPRLFASDHADGTLEQLLLVPESPLILVAGKACAHWLTTGLPLVLLSPVLAVQFDLTQGATLTLALSLALGSPALTLIGSIGAALTLGVRGENVLLALLVLPLFVPVLVFGAGAVHAFPGPAANFLLLGACSVLALAVAPPACAAALRLAVE